jgi:hypothetical protein
MDSSMHEDRESSSFVVGVVPCPSAVIGSDSLWPEVTSIEELLSCTTGLGTAPLFRSWSSECTAPAQYHTAAYTSSGELRFCLAADQHGSAAALTHEQSSSGRGSPSRVRPRAWCVAFSESLAWISLAAHTHTGDTRPLRRIRCGFAQAPQTVVPVTPQVLVTAAAVY